MTADQLTDLAAERACLGALMLDPDDRWDVMGSLDRRDFYRGAHGDTFDAIRGVAGYGGRIDVVRVHDELVRQGRDHPRAEDLTDMTARVPSAVNAAAYAAQVRDLAWRRRVADDLAALHRDALDPATDLSSRLAAGLDRLACDQDEGGLFTPEDFADEVLRLASEGRTAQSVPTGWAPLDRIWAMAPGALTVFAGHPGHGKSSWLDALAVRMAATHGWRTAFYAPESAPSADHAARLVQTWMGSPLEWLKESLTYEALVNLEPYLTWINHEQHSTVAGILAQASAAHARNPLNLLIIDPWSEVETLPDKGRREDQLIGQDLTTIRRWARRSNVHVIVAVHPKQVPRNDDGTLPMPNSQILYGGSVWKKKADSLLAIWRDEQGITRPEQVADISVQKVRRHGIDGYTGRACSLRCNDDTGAYYPVHYEQGSVL